MPFRGISFLRYKDACVQGERQHASCMRVEQTDGYASIDVSVNQLSRPAFEP